MCRENSHNNMTKLTGTLHEDPCTFMLVCRGFLLVMRNVSDKPCRENQNTHFMFKLIFFPRKSCRLWVNEEKYDTAFQATGDNIIRRMRFACLMTKATCTHSEYVILTAFPQKQWLRERASMLRYNYLHCVSLLTSIFKFWHLRLVLHSGFVPFRFSDRNCDEFHWIVMVICSNHPSEQVLTAGDRPELPARISAW